MTIGVMINKESLLNKQSLLSKLQKSRNILRWSDALVFGSKLTSPRKTKTRINFFKKLKLSKEKLMSRKIMPVNNIKKETFKNLLNYSTRR